MKFDKILSTTKKSSGYNRINWLVLHHTGSGTFNGMASYLSGAYKSGRRNVSCHYVVGQGGEVAKIGEHGNILWHLGMGLIDGRYKNMNPYCIGIEIVSDGYNFTNKQRKAVADLCKYIMKEESLTTDQIKRHADFSSYRGKWDVGNAFFVTNFEDWKKSLVTDPGKIAEDNCSDIWRFLENIRKGLIPIEAYNQTRKDELCRRYQRKASSIANHLRSLKK